MAAQPRPAGGLTVDGILTTPALRRLTDDYEQAANAGPGAVEALLDGAVRDAIRAVDAALANLERLRAAGHGAGLDGYDARDLRSWLQDTVRMLRAARRITAGLSGLLAVVPRPVGPLAYVCSRLTALQRDAILGNFTRINPHWSGAGVADILDALDNADSDLGQTEPFFDANPSLASRPGAGYAARALIWSSTPLTAANLTALTPEPQEAPAR